MSDIKLFRVVGGVAREVQGTASALEKPLQSLIEANLIPLLGIRLVASEYSTGKTHAGRIDTLGLDENNSPVIIEYKRASHENIINQGLFYLDWLMDHQAEFKLLVLEKFGKPVADLIEWGAPRLLCIAADFTKYDSHAVQQMNRNIDLIRYREFASDHLLLELVNAVSASTTGPSASKKASKEKKSKTAVAKSSGDYLKAIPKSLQPVFGALETYVLSLGDDVQRKDLKHYIAFKRLRNFATLVFQQKNLRLFLHLDPDKDNMVPGLTRSVKGIGHWGSGDLEVPLMTVDDLSKAKPLIFKAYQGGGNAG